MKLLSVLSRVRGLGSVGQSTVWISFALAIRALIQAFYLIILSRLIGAEQYGLFAGYISVVMLLYPLAGWGISYLIIERLTANLTSPATLLAVALRQIVIIGIPLLISVSFLSGLILDFEIDKKIMMLLCFSEFILMAVSSVAINFFLVFGRFFFAAISMCLVPFFRLLVLSIAVLNDSYLDVMRVSELYVFGAMIGGTISFYLLFHLIGGMPSFANQSSERTLFLAGGRYVGGTLVSNGSQEIDKIMVLHLLGPALLGIYSVAYRIASLLTLPVSALSSAILPKLFASNSRKAKINLMKISLVCSSLYGALGGGVLLILFPFVLPVFGKEFSDVKHLAFPFAVWLTFFSVKTIFCTILTGTNLQIYRILIEFSSLFILIMFCLWLLPYFGSVAATYSLVSADIFIIILCLIILLRKNKFDTSNHA